METEHDWPNNWKRGRIGAFSGNSTSSPVPTRPIPFHGGLQGGDPGGGWRSRDQNLQDFWGFGSRAYLFN